MDKQVRYRAGLETTSKGLPSYSATVEYVVDEEEKGPITRDALLSELFDLCGMLKKSCDTITQKAIE